MPSTKSIVITCAGIGSRLGLATTKALINIEGKSLIAWQLEHFQEVEDIRVVVGFQAQDVIDEVLKFRKDAIFVYNHDYFNTKTGTSFYLGAKDANEYILEWDGDLLVHPDDVKTILNTQGEFICYADILSEEAVFVNTDDAGNVRSFSKQRGDFEWTGPACIKKEKLQYSSGYVYRMLEPFLPMRGIKIRACDIDTYSDYENALRTIKTWNTPNT